MNAVIATRDIGGKTIQPNDYQYSTIRAYLNGSFEQADKQYDDPDLNKYVGENSFLQTAFTSEAQTLIATTLVENTRYGSNDTYDTQDKVFLLSYAEVFTNGALYGFDGNASNRTPLITPDGYAVAKGVQMSNQGTAYWLLRTPDTMTKISVYDVNGGGEVESVNVGLTSSVGVVPAITVTLPAKN